MPGFDGTGPWGQGPLTGGGRGYCAGAVPRPWGARGAGRGWRNQYYATGLTGWQRRTGGFVPTASAVPPEAAPVATEAAEVDPLARLEQSVSEILERLDRLETQAKT